MGSCVRAHVRLRAYWGQKLSPWLVVCSGFRLRLPTLEEHRDKVRGITTAQAQRQAEEERRARSQLKVRPMA